MAFTNHLVNTRRLMIKLSGDAMGKNSESFLSEESAIAVAAGLKTLVEAGRKVGVVIGGGNVLRGAKSTLSSFPRVSLDQMGMLATLLNAKALEQGLLAVECPVLLCSAIDCPQIVRRTLWNETCAAYEKGRVVIFAGGIGNPFFSTDSAAALRGAEMGAELLLKATQVDGVYESDPHTDPKAKRFERLSWTEALRRDLKFMDAAAIALCREVSLPILVFNKSMIKKGEWLSVLEGKCMATYVGDEQDESN